MKINNNNTLGKGLRQGKRLRAQQGSLQPLSKVVAVGNTYRLFFPLVWEDGVADILTSIVPGRQLDRDVIGKSFVVLKDYEVTDAGKVNDLSDLPRWARIAKAIHEATASAALAAATREAQTVAEQMGMPIDENELRVKKQEIQLQYFGDPDAKPNAIYAEINPSISGLKINMATECLLVPMTADGKPDFSKAEVVTVDLNNKKVTQLTTALDGVDSRPEEGAAFLEVSYAYNGKDKKEAGQSASFAGVSRDNRLEYAHPDMFNMGRPSFEMVAKDVETITSRNFNTSSQTTEEEVIEGLKKYVAKHKSIVIGINYESDTTKRAAKDILESGIFAAYDKVVTNLTELLPKEDEEEVSEEEQVSSIDAAIREVEKQNAGLNSVVNAAGGDITGITTEGGEDDVPSEL